MRTVVEAVRETQVIREADVVVLGGGPAGLAASVAAARAGCRTVLIERYGFLGGMGTAAMVSNFCGLFAAVDEKNANPHRRIIHGIVDELLALLAELDGLNRPQIAAGTLVVQSYDSPAYKCAADRLTQGAGVDVLFHTLAVGVAMTGSTIDALLIENKSGRSAVSGKVFIDCSGDADLAAWSGARFEKGAHDGFLAFPTMMFRMGGVDSERAEAEGLKVLRAQAVAAKERGDHTFVRSTPIARAQAHAGEWRVNMTQVSLDGRWVDGTKADDLSRAEVIGREQALRSAQYLRANIPGFESAYLLEIAPQIGIRETRRIVGEYVLTEEDVLRGRRFDDAIGCNGWPIEQHVLGGVKWQEIEGGGYHQIPYRALLPLGVENLLVAGRCASSTQAAQASVRVSGPCLAMGQAAGTAAAMACRTSRRPRDIAGQELQTALREQGVFLGDGETTR